MKKIKLFNLINILSNFSLLSLVVFLINTESYADDKFIHSDDINPGKSYNEMSFDKNDSSKIIQEAEADQNGFYYETDPSLDNSPVKNDTVDIKPDIDSSYNPSNPGDQSNYYNPDGQGIGNLEDAIKRCEQNIDGNNPSLCH